MTIETSRLRYMLLQSRNPDDPIREHEVECFAERLDAPPESIRTHDLITESLDPRVADDVDVFLLGGSGDHSVAHESSWLERALESLRGVRASRTPTFASCWGFQAMARALGGRVVHDLENAEVGTHRVMVTEEGARDALFAELGPTFDGQMGHEDRVVELPETATLLATSGDNVFQAYRFDDAPIYCTQFHPELNREALLIRLRQYPKYVETIARTPMKEFEETVTEAAAASELLKRFVTAIAPAS